MKFALTNWLKCFFSMILTYVLLKLLFTQEYVVELSSLVMMVIMSILFVIGFLYSKPLRKPVNKLVQISLFSCLLLLLYLQATVGLNKLLEDEGVSSLDYVEDSSVIKSSTKTSNEVYDIQPRPDQQDGFVKQDKSMPVLANKNTEMTQEPENTEKELSAEKKQQIDKFFSDIFSAIRSKNWDELVKKSRQPDIKELQNEAMLTFALAQATANGAPFDVLLTLLNDGAQFNDAVLFATVVRQDVKIIEAFVGYGLNLHMRDAEGRTALYYSLFNLSRSDMFDYLLSHNVSTYIGKPQDDLISRVLASCSSTTNAGYFVERILRAGEIITPLHREAFTDLALKNALCVNSLTPYFTEY
ncbi:hypothetical protein DS2_11033 [Catenovulum agarivorans DS-2]|uniref:Uncharacterized protein n=1 Tax=Catenovulum agarivorans DS-2 TaxID=1328313 RepID=W7QAH9_9ALTE|nr:ankyrin repeat domain-containing protein [Catenovulum agarivorans]EWH09814.1 hypothetical protein DS2_11033 [Catenovulum agarivorans DS-2]